MHEERAEGIVLKAIQFKENHRIVTLFTEDHGLISFMAKRVTTPEKMTLFSPLSQIEVIYQKKKSDLYAFKDGTLISDHLALREKWGYLEAAGKMGHMLLHSQMPGKPAPLLYALFISCIKQLPNFEDPAALLLLFHLKLLTHEGVLLWDGPASFPMPLARDQWELMRELAMSRSFQIAQKKRGLGPLFGELEKTIKNLI
jgi:DNA repair protein RecO (recombination protein O)